MSTWSSAVVATSPYGYWRLGEPSGTTAADSSGNGRNATYASVAYSQASLVPTDAADAAIAIDNANDQVSISGASFSSTNFSAMVILKGSGTISGGLFASSTTDYLNLSATIAGRVNSTSLALSPSYALSSLFDGNAHVAWWIVKATSAELWVDGVLVSSGSHSIAASTRTTFQLKRASSGPTSGTYDELALWDRPLTSTEIGTLYAAYSGAAPAVTAGTSVVVSTSADAASVAPANTSVPVASTASAYAIGGAVLVAASAVVAVASSATVVPVQSQTAATTVEVLSSADVVTVDPPWGTSLSREGGRSRSGYAVATWEPAVVAPPSIMVSGEHRMIRGEAFGPVTMVGTQPTYTVSGAVAPRARTRILVGGKDISFFRGVPTPEPEYQLAEPLLWGPSSIELPQVAAAFETLGAGDLAWCAKGKPVTFQRVDAEGNILAVDYRGLVIAHDLSGKTPRLEVGGHGQGRATLRHKPGPIFRDTLDIGRLAWAAIRDLGLRFEPRMGPTTGIKSAVFGNMAFLDYISELCAKAWQRDGTQWSLMPDESGTYKLARKDTTTVHFTVFNDDARTVAALRSDASEEPTTIYATGVTPKGQRVRFGVYPGLTPGPAAPYPFTDDRTFGAFTTDAETDTGDGITVMLRRMWTAGLLSLEEADGFYDADVTRALMALQADAGLAVTGNVNVATWEALFDVATTGYTTRGSMVIPAAEDDATRRYNRSASGQVIGKNPTFDHYKQRVDRPINFETGFTRHQMREWSRSEIARGQDNWTGTLTINGGAVLTGDVAAGATITAADLVDVRAIRPGHNISLPVFGPGILVHVSGVEINRAEDGRPVAVLTVDTQARDAMEVWEIIRRNRESRRDPARRQKGNRASGEIKDSIVEWDEIGGVLDGDRELVAGWNRVRVVGGQEGTVSRIKTLVTAAGTEDGIEYAVAVFGKPMTAARLTELVPNPLGVGGDKKWRDNSEALEKAGALYSAGTEAEPCGYGRGRKDDGADLTGFHIDDAGFSYRCGPDHLLDVLVYVRTGGTLRGGRIMRNQLEAGA